MTVNASAAEAKSRQLAGRQQQSAADLHRRVDPGEGLGVRRHVRADRVGQLAHAVQGGPRRVGGGFRVPEGIHPLPDECN